MSVNRISAETYKLVYQNKENVHGKMVHKSSGTEVNVQVSRTSKVIIQGSRTALAAIENKMVRKEERKHSSGGSSRSHSVTNYHSSSSRERANNIFEPGTGRLLENTRNKEPKSKSIVSCNNNTCPHKHQNQSSSGYHTASSQTLRPIHSCSQLSSFHASAAPSSTHDYHSLRPIPHRHEHRSHSASCSQYRPQDVRNLIQSRNITVARGSSGSGCRCGRSSGSSNLEDDVFVDSTYVSRTHAPFANQKAICYLDPAQSTQMCLPNKPAKRTLAQRLCQTRPSFSDLPTFGSFHTEYLDDYYKYKISMEHKYILRHDFISSRDKTNRTIIVDWLHQVQGLMELSESLYLATVKVLDWTLATIKNAHERYHLLAISCLWIVLKYNSSGNYCYAKDILTTLNGNKYSVKELLQLERRVLKSVNYNLNVHEPLEYAYYWMNKLELLNDKLMLYGVMYLLETISYFAEYSCNIPSLLALGALYLALKRIQPHCLGLLQLYVQDYYTENTIKETAQLLKSRVLLATQPNSVCRTALLKYSTKKMMKVSEYFNN